ncbi:uncharacterized protein LOC110179597 [Drosophila serrata]|uniref:uncharacterized protein LOC110179597 n=1 Tax=Drosophila serrata TaxID=7274 RepID=UPI000A1CFE8E|nr:uncharacterized protein LOC110179597 [Drosophila serrata]
MQRFMASHGKVGNISNSNTLKMNTRTALTFLENGNSPTSINTGYVPVEHKIQQELQDPRSPEKDLKRLRKIKRQITLKASLEKLQHNTDGKADADDDDEEDSAMDPENCDMPSPPRSWIEMGNNELENVHKPAGICSLSAAAYIANGARNGSTKAQLCDLSSKQTPSSRGPIAQWESLIKNRFTV